MGAQSSWFEGQVLGFAMLRKARQAVEITGKEMVWDLCLEGTLRRE